jgi:two-component system KDP operon response regulator KdpE
VGPHDCDIHLIPAMVARPDGAEAEKVKVLIVEDVPEVVASIRLCFNIRWPHADLVSTGRGTDAVGLAETAAPDIVILDIGLPDMSGLDVLSEIRGFPDVPVVIVSACGAEGEMVRGLEMGADDYVVKPFSLTELMARAKAVLRRTTLPELRGDEETVRLPGMTIDLAGHRLHVRGHGVELTPTEWRLLTRLVRNEGRVVTHSVLAERVWGTEFLSPAAIKMCVRRLRQKLGDRASSSSVIRTHRGLGYSFSRAGHASALSAAELGPTPVPFPREPLTVT